MSETTEGWTRIGAYARCRDRDRVLLCRISPEDPAAGYWTLPGGGIDFGEHPNQAVLRELAEETGLVGEIEDLLTVESHTWPADKTSRGVPFHAVSVIYAVRIIDGVLRDEPAGTTDRAAWLTPDEVASIPLTRIARTALALG